jgi:hypothetical protein
MKKQIIFVLALVASFVSACDDTDTAHRPSPPIPPPATEAVIRAFYPNAGAPGTSVAIFGENFGTASSRHYVTFESVPAEITYVGYDMMNVTVPEGLPDGDYSIIVSVEGLQAKAPRTFTVINSSSSY